VNAGLYLVALITLILSVLVRNEKFASGKPAREPVSLERLRQPGL
jgi:hypothetical protein